MSLLLSPHSFAQSSEQPVDNQSKSDRQDDSSKSKAAPFGFPVRILEEPEESESSKRQQKESAEREEKDLVAQESMANSTEQIVLWTKLQFVLAAAGTLALLYTIHLNRRATKAAVEASDAARDALGAERAWIANNTITRAFLTNAVIDDVLEPEAFGFLLEWKNFGRSPAILREIISHHRITAPDEPVPEFIMPETSFTPRTSLIAPGVGFQSGIQAIRYSEYTQLQERKQRLYIYGRVRYSDTFNPELVRETQFCAELQFNGVEEGDGEERPRTFLNPVGPQNTAT
ncbi:MAG: hypothetical protein RIC18_14410 [Hoeflea sp.]|uniref:hypothetical protein n=1 Tax=Hoeflea sp. TaxID=1940281 RepID=UPI0032EDC8A0